MLSCMREIRTSALNLSSNPWSKIMKSSLLSLTLAAIFSLGCNFVLAEDIAEGEQTQPAGQTETSTNPKKEPTADKNAVEKDAAKPTEEPNCE